MKSKPKVRDEFLDGLKQSIKFWNDRIEIDRLILKADILNKKQNERIYYKLQKRYAEDDRN